MSGPRTSAARPTALRAWRDLLEGRALGADPDPDATAAALVRRWAQHFAVAIDAPMERGAAGHERLPEIVDAWLDLARRTAPVRAHVARAGGARTAAEQRRQQALLVGLLAEDLALIGAPSPEAGARELLRSMGDVAQAEDRAGRPLRAHRTAALRAAGLATGRPARGLWRCAALGRRRSAVPV